MLETRRQDSMSSLEHPDNGVSKLAIRLSASIDLYSWLGSLPRMEVSLPVNPEFSLPKIPKTSRFLY